MRRHQIDGPLMSVPQAAERLGRGVATAYEWARRGELPGLVTLNGRMYVRRAMLEAWIAGDDGQIGTARQATPISPR